DRAERRAGQEERADDEQQDAEDRRPRRADRHPDEAAEHLAEIAALVAAEAEHQAERGDDEPGPEGPDVDERAAKDHQAAQHDEGHGDDPRRRADQRVEAVGERAADIAAVPARIDDAAEEDTECDEPEAPELGMFEGARAAARGSPLLHAGRRLRAQLALALLARHTPHVRPPRVASSYETTATAMP